jgi:hypothetical protein
LYGETYWHRTHQIPGVVYCPKHYIRLVDSRVSYKKASTSFCAASSDVFSENVAFHLEDNLLQFKDKFLKLGKESVWLLNQGMDIDWDLDILSKYKMFFREMGVSSVRHGVIDYDSLTAGFNEYWGEDFLKSLYLETGDTSEWMLGFHAQRAVRFKTLYHILLMCFLKESIEKFLQCQIPANPFGEEPWPCENPICQRHMVENTKIQYTNGGATGFFQCEHCGMLYKRIKKREGYIDAIIVDYGFLWKDKLKRCLGVDKMTISEAAETLNCSPHIIPWQKKKLGINTNDYLKKPRNFDAETGAEAHYKSLILELCKQNEAVTPQYLKNHYPAAYSYFCINDFAWLRAHVVYEKDLECWREQDRDLLKQIQEAIEHIKSGDNKRHLTPAYIARIAGVNGRLLNTPQRRPLTKAYINEVTESREDWLRRRIIMLCHNRKERGFRITTFAMVKRNLSLKPNTYVTHKKLIEEVLREQNLENEQHL